MATQTTTHYEDVDVAIVMESTYPYLKGGVSAVVHDIILGNPDQTFGIIHITWDSAAPHTDLYGMPENVRWVKPLYLSMQEHEEDFINLRPSDLGLNKKGRKALAHRLFDALDAIVEGDPEPMWTLYDEGMNPRTRSYPIWALLGSKEFMQALRERIPGLDLSLVDSFWVMREFFSLACAVLGDEMPRAKVYHAHTTGYASVLSAAAARQHGTSFLLTEHNLYVRDTVNELIGRSMALPVTAQDYRTFDVTPKERAWMAWWIEMQRFAYPSAEAITYLYPTAIMDASDLGAPVERAVVIPNGMVVEEFAPMAAQREVALEELVAGGSDHTWRLVYIARVVPIKGLLDLLDSLRMLLDRGITNFHLDVLGPTEHVPEYYEQCLAKIKALGVEEHVTIRGTVNVREILGGFDLLVLPSYNEGQPIVVLEAMAGGIPTVGTNVGGMQQLIGDPLTNAEGETLEACGLLVEAGDPTEMADNVAQLMQDPAQYRQMSVNARRRVESFFQLRDVTDSYNKLYLELSGELTPVDPHSAAPSAAAEESAWSYSRTAFSVDG